LSYVLDGSQQALYDSESIKLYLFILHDIFWPRTSRCFILKLYLVCYDALGRKHVIGRTCW
jgi:hypothetical protein